MGVEIGSDERKKCEREIIAPCVHRCPREEQPAGKNWQGAISLNVGVCLYIKGMVLALDFFSNLNSFFAELIQAQDFEYRLLGHWPPKCISSSDLLPKLQPTCLLIPQFEYLIVTLNIVGPKVKFWFLPTPPNPYFSNLCSNSVEDTPSFPLLRPKSWSRPDSSHSLASHPVFQEFCCRYL